MAEWRANLDAVPERLQRFVMAEWDGDPSAWGEECLRWLDNHPGRRLPFGPYGDRIDVIRAVRELRLLLS
jgi:hypothetical protein